MKVSIKTICIASFELAIFSVPYGYIIQSFVHCFSELYIVFLSNRFKINIYIVLGARYGEKRL